MCIFNSNKNGKMRHFLIHSLYLQKQGKFLINWIKNVFFACWQFILACMYISRERERNSIDIASDRKLLYFIACATSIEQQQQRQQRAEWWIKHIMKIKVDFIRWMVDDEEMPEISQINKTETFFNARCGDLQA